MINEDATEHKSEKSHKGHEGHTEAEEGAETGEESHRGRGGQRKVTKVLVEPGGELLGATADTLYHDEPFETASRLLFKTFVTFSDLRALRVILPTVV